MASFYHGMVVLARLSLVHLTDIARQAVADVTDFASEGGHEFCMGEGELVNGSSGFRAWDARVVAHEYCMGDGRFGYV